MTPTKIPSSTLGANTSVAKQVNMDITPSYHLAFRAWMKTRHIDQPDNGHHDDGCQDSLGQVIKKGGQKQAA